MYFYHLLFRFHLEYKAAKSKGNREFTLNYPYNSQGFHKWCSYLGNKYAAEESEIYDQWNQNLPESVYEKAKNVPCYSEFYKYLQWHNNAFFVTEDAMKLPTLIVHYEDFYYNEKKTAIKMARFLDSAIVEEGKPFRYHTYDYFTTEERSAAVEFMNLLASPALRDELSRYLDPVEKEEI